MSIYTVEIDGKRYDIEGDHEPSEKEAREAIKGFSQQPQQKQQPAQGSPFTLNKLVEAGLLGPLGQSQTQQAIGNFVGGAIQPFAQIAGRAAQTIPGVPKNIDVPLPQSLGGNINIQPAQNLGQALTPVGLATLTMLGVKGARGENVIPSEVKPFLQVESNINQARKAKTALDSIRANLGKAKDLAIQSVADVATDATIGTTSTKVINAIRNPVYEIAFDESGVPVQTVGNLDKVKEAVGDLIHTPKMWEEAGNKEIQVAKRYYGQIVDAMKTAAAKAGKPIDDSLKAYENFMDNYRRVNKTLVDQSGEAIGNSIKKVFNVLSEPATKEAWKEVSNYSPEIKQVMNSMQRRSLLRDLVKGGVTLEAGKRVLTGKF